jgi:outer membrane murein-binding lipoprotein Lpp
MMATRKRRKRKSKKKSNDTLLIVGALVVGYLVLSGGISLPALTQAS